MVNPAAACLRGFRLAKVDQVGTTRHDSSCRSSEKQEPTPAHHKNGMETFNRIAPDVSLGRSVKIFGFANLYGCTVGDESRIGCFVEIQKNAIVGARCKISSHSFICEGVTIEDDVFIGHHVCFINDLFPRASRPDGTLQTDVDWKVIPIVVKRRATIGSGAVILGGVTIGAGAIVGAGAVVTKSVAPRTVVAGNPGRLLRTLGEGEAP